MGCGAVAGHRLEWAPDPSGKKKKEDGWTLEDVLDEVVLEDGGGSAASTTFKACKYGLRCYQTNEAHLKEYVHPGDENYRCGRVKFERGQGPEFETLWQLFMYFDADATGHCSEKQFEGAYLHLVDWAGADPWLRDQAWTDTCGSKLGHVTFAQLAMWAKRTGLKVPIGVGIPGGVPVCRFRPAGPDGPRCKCSGYRPDEGGILCHCGHKASMHRSDTAELPACGLGQTAHLLLHWQKGEEGLVEVSDLTLLGMLQELLDVTHKVDDNWTRDRGCSIHGVGTPGCTLACAAAHRVAVPNAFVLRRAFRNQNMDLWEKYFIARTAILEECKGRGAAKGDSFNSKSVVSQSDLDAPLLGGCNEWRLMHGSSMKACRDVCKSGFMLSLARSGATWKDESGARGVPLYGDGVYLAERITKADEYSTPLSDADIQALLDSGALQTSDDIHTLSSCFAMLIVRCVGGRTNVITTNAIDREKLRADVFNGQFHSVFGDRVSVLKKPFSEVVIYDADQVFPEYLLLYERIYCSR